LVPILFGYGTLANSLQGMDCRTGRLKTAAVTPMAESRHFGGELRRWRSLRRLSQLELANRSGTTQRHVSFMEQGRSHPGRSIVIRLAESLQLSLRERNALLLSAGYAPAFGESDLNGALMRPVREAIERVIEGHLPYPAVVLRGYGAVIAANRAVAVFLEDADPALLRPPVNLLRLMLHPNGMARAVDNLGQWGRHVVENLRARARKSPDAGLAAFIAELESYLPEFDAGHGYLGFSTPLRLRRAEGDLHLLTALTSFATAVDITLAELHLEAFLPADDQTAEILRARDLDAASRGLDRLWDPGR
jgi:transcriptional regulator with XRE-family HTH domain